jgi:hypothetical protein
VYRKIRRHNQQCTCITSILIRVVLVGYARAGNAVLLMLMLLDLAVVRVLVLE